MSRTGRRPGTPDTRDAILAVARRRFATRGYEATSLRGIAADAKVDPALLIHYFGTKEGLFTAATGLPEAALEASAVADPHVTVGADVQRLLAAPSLPPKVSVSGHVYDIATGRVTTALDARYP